MDSRYCMEALRVGRRALEPGTTLGSTYRVGRMIGQGGMGEVYEARHARLAGRYAVKVIRREVVALDPATLQRFQREAEVTSSLRHPNIVQIIDFDVGADGSPFIVMEYLEGSDLQARMEQRGPMPLAEALRIIEQIASALAAAHERSVVHRDLKPANVFLVPLPVTVAGAPTEFVKVLDFGISKVRTEGTLSRQPSMMGTPHYMSPEQARMQSDDVDGRTDQFALAAIAYELLSGRKAFPGDTIEGVLYAVVHEQPASLAPVVGEAVDRVLSTALAKERSARHPSITTFVNALRLAASRSGQLLAGAARGAPNITFETGSPVHAASPVYAANPNAPTAAVPYPAEDTPAPQERTSSSRTRTSRVTIGFVVATAVIAVVGLALLNQRRSTQQAGPSAAQLAQVSDAVRARVSHALTEELSALASQVQTAAKIPELRNAAVTRIDAFTFNDLFATEEWWQPYRSLVAVVFDGDRALVTRGAPDVTSASAWRFWAPDRGQAPSAVVVGEQRAYLAAGVPLAGKGALGLVLASPLDAERLARLAASAGVQQLVVSDGKRLFGAPSGNGAAETAAAVMASLGREAEPAVVLPGGRLALAVPRPGGIWVWTIVDQAAPVTR